MSFHNCPACGLSIRRYPHRVAPKHCPRCIAKRDVAVPMYSSPHPVRVAARGRTLSDAEYERGWRGVPPRPDAGTAA